MFLRKVVNNLKFIFYMVKINIIAQMQYKLNFILQIFGMFFNDAALASLWMIFFKQFPSINGWSLQDTMLLLAISWTSFFLIFFFCGGITEMTRIINLGQLDQFLLLPKPLLLQVATSKSNFWEIGNLIVNIYLFHYSGYLTISKIPLLFFLIPLGSLIIFNFLVIIHTLSFYFGNIEYATDKLTKTLFDLIYFPPFAIQGIIRFISMTLIPGFFIGIIPMQIVKEFSLFWFLVLIVFVIAQTIFRIYFFKQGLKKYESGSLIQMKI